ncbi:MAG TPA: sigma 54-interacting transcriptional regulator [Polyangiaceae bacterium]|nr:sigma 54-interacting transcriptional regulator [Polyangiaceae bacterium]
MDGDDHFGAEEGQTLEIRTEPDAGPWAVEIGSESRCHVLSLEDDAPLVVGSGFGADVRVEDRTVSARHARLRATAGGVYVEDLASRNGVWVGGARVSQAHLSPGAASLVVGRTTLTVRSLQEARALPERFDPIPGLVGGSVPMRRLTAELRRCASLRAPVLLQGESGAGKDLAARALHHLSRRSGAFVPLNVATIPSALADAELFGHRRGAFTGAIAARAGAFEEADQGTLFLDEVADLDPAIQAKLLRVVEEQLVRPVGGGKPLPVDVRIVSATWAALDERVGSGLFREDLYHRISTFVIRVPPLRTRKSDIPVLARTLLHRIRDEVGERSLTSSALARLVAHAWPGNVRELSSVLYRAAVAARGEHVTGDDVDGALSPPKGRARSLSRTEAAALLSECGGNASAASRAAGVPRSTFRSWLER